jgi:DNA-binding beta-propeller fold protein YncE
MKRSIFIFTILAFCQGFAHLQAQTGEPDYTLARTIHLSGDGGWDYLSVDEINSRLFVSHSSQVNVISLKSNEQIAVIPDTPGVHGIAIANDLNRAYISCGRDASVVVVDLKTLEPMKKVQVTGENPDCIFYDAFSKKVFTFNGRSSNATVLDANSLEVLATIPLAGKPEFAQSDGMGKIYVNIEDKSSLSVIDAASMKVLHTWPINPGQEPSGLGLDNKNHRLFSVCGNEMMVVTDANTGKIITTVPIGRGCDGVAFDPELGRIYASNGEGKMTVIQQESADSYRVLENVETQAGARTITLSKTNHHVYLSCGEYEPGEGRRPVKPGTFEVLDFEPLKL